MAAEWYLGKENKPKIKEERQLQKSRGSKRIHFGRICFTLLAIIFALCVVSQVLLAGLATFVNPVNWAKHTTFVHLFGFNLPVLMFIMAFVGNMPRWAHWQSAGLIGLIYAMYFSANITAVLPWAAATHPVIALVIFWMSIIIVSKAWRLAFTSPIRKER